MVCLIPLDSVLIDIFLTLTLLRAHREVIGGKRQEERTLAITIERSTTLTTRSFGPTRLCVLISVPNNGDSTWKH